MSRPGSHRRNRDRLDGNGFPGEAYFARWGDDDDSRDLPLTGRRRGPSRRVPVRVPLWWRLTRWLR